MRVAVIGAHGLTGGATVRALRRRGHEVVAIVRRDAPVPGASEHVVAASGFNDQTDAVVATAEALVHVAGIGLGDQLAALPSFRAPRRAIVVSTASIYSRHRPLAALYLKNEELIASIRPDATFVRPTMIYGSSRDRNVHRVMAFARHARFLPVPGDGRALVQPIFYADLADALARLVDVDAPGVVDAGGARALSVSDAACTVLHAVGRRALLIHVPLAPARLGSALLDRMWSSRWRERIERALEDRSVDNARLVALTGLRPRPFDTGVSDMLRQSDD